MGGSAEPHLAGRTTELKTIELALGQLGLRRGHGMLIRGEPGAGKTALLAALGQRARQAGGIVATACADRWEADIRLGVVRQLWRQGLSAGAGDGQPSGDPDELYRRSIALAAGRPLVIAVDNLHWADAGSVRQLAYLLRRIAGQRVLIAVTTEQAETDLEAHFDEELVLTGLSVAAVGEVMARVLGTAVEPEISAVCHLATAGNPGLLHALLSALRQSVPGGAAGTAELVGTALRTPPIEVVCWLRRALAAREHGSRELVDAVAVLGGEPVELDLAAEIAGLAPTAVAHLADGLAEAGLLSWQGNRVRLRSGLIRAAALSALAPGARRVSHARAATLLHRRGAASSEVATQLVRSGPLGQPWAADVLCSAATKATADRAPDRAARYLRLALREPVPDQRRAEFMIRIGAAMAPIEPGAAVRYLQRAVAVTADPAVRADAARRLAGLLCAVQRDREGLRTLRELAEPLDECAPEVALSLRVEESLLSLLHLPAAKSALASGPASVELSVLHAVDGMMSGHSGQQVAALSRQALDHHTEQARTISVGQPLGVLALATSDDLQDAAGYADTAVDQAHRERCPLASMRALSVRSEVNYRLGRLARCRDDARTSLDLLVPLGYPRRHGLALLASARLVDSLVDSGELDQAVWAVAEAEEQQPSPDTMWFALLLASRGRLRTASGAPEQGLADLLECGRLLEERGVRNPAMIAWRSLAALSQAALGASVAARDLVEEELDLARRWGGARSIGIALGVSGTLAKGSTGIALLREAVDLLERSGAVLEQARAQASLGTLLRKTNQLAAARHYLRQAATGAQQCGAAALVRRARAELVLAEARRHGKPDTGLDALTATELRVAALAAQGLSNREISERLFVVRRTVEIHLSSVYRKLGIKGRTGLPGLLATP